ncbi:proclotting enzyme isoform X2 [Aethina tumida]|uniref:proclotting enzyme isoform X2 n=1 Tax=Aethina tumida TaxID=116153 RepID=UPI00096B60DD|nr:proclotting enzyme isoform X2 [Aethina tumida]
MGPLKQTMTIFLATILLCIMVQIVESQQSPCPRIFRYVPTADLDMWHGEILTSFDDDLIDGVFVTLVFDRNTIQIGSNFGQQILRRSEHEYLLRNLGLELPAKTPLHIKFYVKYDPALPRPKLKAFRVNGRPICPETNTQQNEYITSKPAILASNPEQTELELDLRDHPEPTVTNQDNRGGPRDETPDERCGLVFSNPVGLIANGKESAPGEWPWHVAILKIEGAQASYICGGTLIGKRHVLTAAHCVIHKPSNSILSPESLTLFLGRNNLRYVSQNEQQRDVSEIYVHPDFLETGLKNDIAILKLSTPIMFTNFVRPVCLWKESTSLETVINRKGTVIGWGLDENKKISAVLRKVDIPVVSTPDCLYSNVNFFSNVLWQKNYCAGFHNGTSVCNGDSGGGMFFRIPGRNGEEGSWQIRGLVSIGVGNQGYRSVCESNEYTVFTDVAQYLDWIANTIKK